VGGRAYEHGEPTAQDFRAAFELGNDDTTLY
jgi:hypothetical protein